MVDVEVDWIRLGREGSAMKPRQQRFVDLSILATRGVYAWTIVMLLLAMALIGCGADTSDREGPPGTGGAYGSGGHTSDSGSDTGICPPGTFGPTCQPCVAGQYCAGGEAAPVDCGSGIYDDDLDPATPCIEWSDCEPGQMETGSPSAIADRQCQICETGSFNTETNAKSCMPWSQPCAPGQVESTAPSTTQDRVCTDCEAGMFCAGDSAPPIPCEAGSWDHDSDSATECVVCDVGTYCAGGTTEPVECPIGTWDHDEDSATECEICGPGTYCAGGSATRIGCETQSAWDDDNDSSTACVPWSSCEPGQYASTPGTATADRDCSACPDGTFSTSKDAASCSPWKACPPGQYIAIAGTPTANPICIDCPDDSFSATDNSPSCTAWTVCQPGEYVIMNGSTVSDRSCGGCLTGTYSSELNANSCKTWATCTPGQYVVVAGTTSSNRICSDCPDDTYTTGNNQSKCLPHNVCAAGTIQTAPGTPTTPPACKACEAGTYCAGDTAPKVACGNGTWDHDADSATVCAPWTACVAGKYISKSGTATTDQT
ncbi:MAG TPA: hypothetical protein PKW66_05510, partial [Polyangiaceae bacterium]|nr:hypothetical protein [Polyangiaceae bacterium]